MRRLIDHLLGARCLVCREWSRYPEAHLHVNHPGGV